MKRLIEKVLKKYLPPQIPMKKIEKIFEHKILAINWFHKSRKIGIIVKDLRNTYFKIGIIENDEIVIKSSVEIQVKSQIQFFRYSEDENFLLLVMSEELIIVEIKNGNVQHKINVEIKLKKINENIDFHGFSAAGIFHNGKRVWFTPIINDGLKRWAEWDLTTQKLHFYDVEMYAHYSRGAIIHPSQKLIGVLWNTYANGFLMHKKSIKKEEVLEYYDFSANEECLRNEYENYLPKFDLSGNKIAFVTNPHLANHVNHDTVCIYNIHKPNQVLGELQMKNHEFGVKDIEFNQSLNALIICTNDLIDIYFYHENKVKTIAKEKIDKFSCHKLSPLIARTNGKKLIIVKLEVEEYETYDNLIKQSDKIATKFITEHDNKLKFVENE